MFFTKSYEVAVHKLTFCCFKLCCGLLLLYHCFCCVTIHGHSHPFSHSVQKEPQRRDRESNPQPRRSTTGGFTTRLLGPNLCEPAKPITIEMRGRGMDVSLYPYPLQHVPVGWLRTVSSSLGLTVQPTISECRPADGEKSVKECGVWSLGTRAIDAEGDVPPRTSFLWHDLN